MAREYFFDREDCGAHGLEVLASEFVVATAAASDIQEYAPLSALLDRVRKAFGIDGAFVSEWAGGEPVVRGLAERSEVDTLQRMYGLRLLGGDASARTPFRFDAVPVVTDDGTCHGLLCCRRPARSGRDDDSAETDALRSVARLIANWFEEAQLAVAA